MKIKLSSEISFPIDIVTQTVAIVAKRRVGKSFTMKKMVEQLFYAKQQVVIVDPKGDQWGIRSSADGKSKGLPIMILGGEHGDVPLEANAGEVVAKLVVEERVSVLLDLSMFRKNEVATFMTAFLENIYRLKAKEQYRTAMMLVIDEADAISAPAPTTRRGTHVRGRRGHRTARRAKGNRLHSRDAAHGGPEQERFDAGAASYRAPDDCAAGSRSHECLDRRSWHAGAEKDTHGIVTVVAGWRCLVLVSRMAH